MIFKKSIISIPFSRILILPINISLLLKCPPLNEKCKPRYSSISTTPNTIIASCHCSYRNQLSSSLLLVRRLLSSKWLLVLSLSKARFISVRGCRSSCWFQFLPLVSQIIFTADNDSDLNFYFVVDDDYLFQF